jgi:hypothetical protein
MPLALDDTQMDQLLAAAELLPTHIARRLTAEPTDEAVIAALTAQLDRLPRFLYATTKRTKQMTRRYEDFHEDDAFDDNGLLRDGHKIRVPLTMRDAMTPLQREIATKRARLTDGTGNYSKLAFSRPGWRMLADASVNDARETAHAEYLADLTTAWRRGAGKEEVVSDVPKTSGNDAMPVSDIETAYRLYAEEISQAWKKPR